MIIACTGRGALAQFSAQSVSIVLFPPVSERDQAGIEELENQTRNLLAFREIGPSSFDAQVAFNLLPRYGEESRPRLRGYSQGEYRAMLLVILPVARPFPQFNWCKHPCFTGMLLLRSPNSKRR